MTKCIAYYLQCDQELPENFDLEADFQGNLTYFHPKMQISTCSTKSLLSKCIASYPQYVHNLPQSSVKFEFETHFQSHGI